MRRFLLKTAIALCIALCFHLLAAWHADGSSDAYYLRFTGHRHASLIIGTSRGAQGIDPTAFAEGKKGDGWAPDLFNFAFTRANSPYGPTYLRAIAGKLDPGQDNGLFLVSVDPWALSERKDENGFPESERFLGRMHTFNSTPNPEYLIRCYGAGWGALLGGPLVGADTTLFLHEDGWLEVRIPMDSASVATRSAQKKREYARLAEEFNFRPDRLGYLEQTIEFLKPHGTVVLVRIPVSGWMRDLENEYRPGFSNEMQRLANAHHALYVDDTEAPGPYLFTDGNHLAATSAKEYSRWLATRLR